MTDTTRGRERPSDELVDRPGFRTAVALRLERLGVVFAATAILVGSAVLVGYATHNESIVQLSARLPPMYPNAALGIMCGGIAVIVSRRQGALRLVAAAATTLLATIGVVSLWLNVAESDRTWFEGLFPLDFVSPTTPVGGRPVAETCVAFGLLAAALGSLVTRRGAVVGQALGVAGASVGFSAVLGYLLGVDRTSLGASLVYVGMALHTALGITLVGLAIVLVRPNVGIVAQLLDGGVGGTVTRRVTLAVTTAPVVLVVLGVMLSRVLPTEELSQSVFSVMQIAVLSGAVLVAAAIISRTEAQLRLQLDSARRRDEHRDDVGTVMRSITAEMNVAVPDLPGWEIGMRYQPATGHMAGDSVQVHHRNDPQPATLIAILDVAGHDAHAAVVAYAMRVYVEAIWQHGATLDQVAESLNAELVRRRTIATGVLMSFLHASHDLEFVNAGHPPPIHVRSGHVTTWPRTGPLLGVSDTRRDTVVHQVDDGELIVVYTDGLPEARSSNGKQLGEDVLVRTVHARRLEPAQTIADECVDAALEHSNSRLADDVLIFVARRTHAVAYGP